MSHAVTMASLDEFIYLQVWAGEKFDCSGSSIKQGEGFCLLFIYIIYYYYYFSMFRSF